MARKYAWTEERRAELTRLAGEGLTDTQIAKHFGLSRDAIIQTRQRYNIQSGAEQRSQWLTQPAGRPDAQGDPTDAEVMRLEAECRKLNQQLRDTRAKLGRAQDEGVLFGLLSEVIRAETAHLPITGPRPQRPAGSKTDTVEECVALLSDAHADKLIRPERVMGFEDYNWSEFERRFTRYVDSLVGWTHGNLAQHRFDRLWVYMLGDHVEGAIHGGDKHTAFQHAMLGALSVGDVFAAGIAELAQFFPEIVLVCVSGNHPRQTKPLDWRGARENFDFLVATQVATRLQDYVEDGRVTVHAPDSWMAAVQVCGWNFLLSHGHEVKGWNGIPWYGLERKARRMAALFPSGTPLHYFCHGHFHQAASTPTPGGETYGNGAWFATDEFALDALGSATRPMQWLLGVHEERGVSWRLPIHVSAPIGQRLPDARFRARILDEVAGGDAGRVPGMHLIRAVS